MNPDVPGLGGTPLARLLKSVHYGICATSPPCILLRSPWLELSIFVRARIAIEQFSLDTAKIHYSVLFTVIHLLRYHIVPDTIGIPERRSEV